MYELEVMNALPVGVEGNCYIFAALQMSLDLHEKPLLSKVDGLAN